MALRHLGSPLLCGLIFLAASAAAATDEGGGARPYVAEVDVVIRDGTGSVVMSVPSAGPYFFARLKPGRYTVEATYLDKPQMREVIVKEGATTRDVLTWPRP